MKTVMLIFLAYYLGAGIGTVLKYYDYDHKKLNSILIAKILFCVPIEAFAVMLMCYFGCFPDVYDLCKKRLKISGLGCVSLFFSLAVLELRVCFRFMPVIAGKFALHLINSKKIVHFLRKTKNDCTDYVVKETGLQYC